MTVSPWLAACSAAASPNGPGEWLSMEEMALAASMPPATPAAVWAAPLRNPPPRGA